MLCDATKRGWRHRCILSSIVAALLLAPVAEAYMSTMHLGRTIKSLRARLEEQQQQQQQQQEDQQRQHQQQLPPGLIASPSPDQPGVRRDTDGEVAHDGAEYEAAADETTVATHPSWGSPADNGNEEPAGPAEGQPAPTAVDELEGGSKHAEDAAACDSVIAAREQHGSLKQREDPTDRRVKLSTPRTSAAAAATTAAAGAGIGGITSRQATSDADVSARFSKEQVHEAKENQNVSSGAQSGRSTATAGGRGIVGTAAAAGILSASGTTPAEEEPVGVSKEGVETSSTGLGEAEATAAEAAAAAAAAAGADGDQVKVSKEEEEEEGINERAQRDEAMEEELEAAAIREILGLRSAQDRKVQVAAARAVEALPPTQRECFEDVKAFAFGGASEGKEGAGLSEEEVEALNTVAICGDRDGVVLAFLRHSKFDVRKAKESMRRCCAWRKENKADDLFKRAVSPAKMKKYRTHWPTGFHKQDRAGRPVFYDRVGQSDLSKLREDPDGLDQDEMVQIFTQNMEVRRRFVLTRLSREAGRPVDQMTTVLDLTGLGMKHMSKEAMAYTRRISDVFQDNYSGMTSSLLILNAPWVFSKGWQVVESFLSEDTVAKVKVLGKGEAGLKQLEEYIPKENIPEFLGGESRAVIGPSDPLWSDVDRAVRLWGDDGDPFLDPSEVKRVSRRIARERTSSSSKSKSKSKSKSRARSRSAIAASGAKGVQEEAVPSPATATTGAVERDSKRGAADCGKKVRVTSSREAAAASVSRVRKTTRSSSSKRSKRQLGVPDSGKTVKGESEGGLGHAGGEPAVDGEEHEDRKRKNHHRQRDGLVSSEGTTGAGPPSLSSYRRASSLSVSRRAASDEAGSPSRKTRGSKRTTPQEDYSEEGLGTEDIIGDDGKAVALGDTVIGERALQGVANALGPVLGAYFLQIVAGLASVGRVLWGTVESVLLLLRDLFFEQIEVEE